MVVNNSLQYKILLEGENGIAFDICIDSILIVMFVITTTFKIGWIEYVEENGTDAQQQEWSMTYYRVSIGYFSAKVRWIETV